MTENRLEEYLQIYEPDQLFENLILDVPKIAKLLDVSTKTIYKYCKLKKIPHHKPFGERGIRFYLLEIIEWIKGE